MWCMSPSVEPFKTWFFMFWGFKQNFKKTWMYITKEKEGIFPSKIETMWPYDMTKSGGKKALMDEKEEDARGMRHIYKVEKK